MMGRRGTRGAAEAPLGGGPWSGERAGRGGVGRRRVVSGAGALALAAAGGFGFGVAGTAGAAAQQPAFADDAEALNLALSVERLSVALLAGGLAAFDPAAFAAAGLPETARADIEAMLEQDQAHAARLAEAIADLGGTPVEADSDPPIGDDAAAFVELAAVLKETAVAAYAAVAQGLTEPDQRPTALGIHSVEARHAAHLQGLLGAPAFPAAIDPPLGRSELAAALAALAAGQPPTASARRGRGTDQEPEEPEERQAAGDRPPRETRRVQDAPDAADAAAPDAEPDQPAGPPPVQEIPIQGTTTTGGIGSAEATPSAEPEPEPEPDPEPDPEPGSGAGERRRGGGRERPPGEEGASGTAGQERFAAVVADAAAQLGVEPAAVQILAAEQINWPDASLGCPQPGEFYAQVVTPGFRVVVAADGSELEYHTDRRGKTFVLCQ